MLYHHDDDSDDDDDYYYMIIIIITTTTTTTTTTAITTTMTKLDRLRESWIEKPPSPILRNDKKLSSRIHRHFSPNPS